jgi:hypothetical protein
MQGKPVVSIYLQKDKRTSKILLDFLNQHIDALNKVVYVKLEYVTKNNVGYLKRKGITKTPTMIFGDKIITSVEEIIKKLTPPERKAESFGLGIGSPDELIYAYQTGVIISNGDEEEDDLPGSNRSDELRRKMAAIQKRRPQMEGVDSSKKLKGGRKISYKENNTKFNNDMEFKKAAGVDNIIDTPINKYLTSEDGDSILEDYKNHEADSYGRKLNNKPIRWST